MKRWLKAVWFTGIVAMVLSGALIVSPEVQGADIDEGFEEFVEFGDVDTELEEATVIETSSENVTLDFKEADIRNVLRILSYKSGVNIVAGKGVEGPVTIRLVDVPWEKALDVILKTYDFGYERDGNIITVSPLEAFTQKKVAEKELAEVEPLVTEVFRLKYLDANDAAKVLRPQLSSRGKITVLEIRSPKGWAFGTGGGAAAAGASGATFGKRARISGASGRSKVLVISDIVASLKKLKEVIVQIDTMPKQIMIETRIMEVDTDALKDIGFDWATGPTGTESDTLQSVFTGSSNKNAMAVANLGSQIAPSIFDPSAESLDGTESYNTGLSIMFQRLSGVQFQVLVHALEEDVKTNTLSAPRIMTLDNQEATILVGTKYPILEAQVSGTESTTTVATLSYYEDIGIQLNVVPQTGAGGYINMIVHPVVSSFTETLKSRGPSGEITAEYPIINTREAETQVLIQNGETIVIGGLLKDVESKGKFSVPILGDLPLIGPLFQRDTTDTSKIDLLIFITARVVEPSVGRHFAYGSQAAAPTLQEFKEHLGESSGEDFSEPMDEMMFEEPYHDDIEEPEQSDLIDIDFYEK
jgi:type IV pilus assembly protein PilQ